jgi:hypothetical protein
MQVLLDFICQKSYFLLLFIAEVFVPLYTGRLLSSVAFKDKWETFKHNLIMFVIVNFSGYEYENPKKMKYLFHFSEDFLVDFVLEYLEYVYHVLIFVFEQNYFNHIYDKKLVFLIHMKVENYFHVLIRIHK